MSFLGLAAGGLLGGLLDRETGKQTNTANLQANQNNIADAQRSRDESRKALTGTVGNVGTTQNAGGGFDTNFLPGTSGSLLQQGDIGRANNINALTGTGAPQLSREDALNIVRSDNQDTQGLFDKQLNTVALRTNQTGNPGSSNFNPNMATALSEAAQRMRPAERQTALELMNKFNAGSSSNLQAQLANNQMQAPNLQGVGGQAASINAQIPLPSQVPDLSSAITPAAGSNFVAQIMQQQAGRQAQDDKLNLIRALGNQGAWNKGTV